MRRAATSLLVLGLAGAMLGGCALFESNADALFAAGDLAAAKTAYESDLEGSRVGGRREERALYHLGLIHSRPESEFHNPVEARRYLERLLEIEPASRYATQAATILDLQLTASRLRGEMADQKSLARLLLAELQRLRLEAERIESAATDEQERARRLAGQIQALEKQMAALATELAAREEELERLKKIDLEDPP